MTYRNNMCLECNVPLERVSAGVRKDGTTYDSFMGCPNYRNHKGKKGSHQKPNMSAVDPIKIISDEIIAMRDNMLTEEHFNERMDGLAKFLNDKFK